ncbi:MAG: hypothetical protein ACR2HG_10610 [Pyrinomonadaceae bacterium]
MEDKNSEEWLKKLPLQAENIAYKPEEIILCAKCGRTNPPTRRNCFYCTATLEISEAQSRFLKPNLRRLETWEKGFNIIFKSAAPDLQEAQTTEIARLLKMEKEFLGKIIASGKSLPLARAESLREAEITQKCLSEFGVETRLVSDEDLAFDKPARRLRRIEFYEDKLILIFFNQDEIAEIAKEDLALIVAGATFARKVSATEKYNKKGDNKILETSEIASDETLIDIYSRRDSIGYRILATGFDFSGLETEKKMLAKDNIKTLAENLRRFAPNAKFVDDYLQNRELLADVWEVEQKNDSQGLKRESFGRFNLGTTTIVNNSSQFTKYSRLQWHLL